VHRRVELDQTVTSLLGTVVIRHHLGGHLCAQNHVVHSPPPDTTHPLTCRLHFSSALLRVKCFNTIQPAS